MEYLLSVHGIGPVMAKKLWKSFKPKPKNKKEVNIKLMEIFDDLPVSAQIDLIEKPGQITWEEIDVLNNILSDTIKGIKWKIAGGYIRKKHISNDIDIVVSKGNSNDIWSKWQAQTSILAPDIIFGEPYAGGESKLSIILKLFDKKVRVDIFLVEPHEWVTTLLYATGSGKFNIMMRSIAKRKGYMLNQKCLAKNGKCIKATERQIFKLLGMEWVPPEDRNV